MRGGNDTRRVVDPDDDSDRTGSATVADRVSRAWDAVADLAGNGGGDVPVEEAQLAESKAIHRTTGNNFYYATRLFPERVRYPTYVLYGFFRVADEVVDGPGEASAAEQRTRLREIRAAALGRKRTDDPVVTAFSDVREQYGIRDEEIVRFIDAMLMDVETSRYESYEALETYMRGSAAAVGVMMTTIMEPDDFELALPYARKLGVAFQLTNFLRDVGEDVADHGRVYLPQETLEAYGADVVDLERRVFTEELGDAIEHELRRTERLYRGAVPGIEHLPRDCQLPVLMAAVLYAEHHRLIRERGYDTVTETPSLGTVRKLVLVAKTWWHWLLIGDPESVFERVSAISPPDTRLSRVRSNDLHTTY